jgi:allophanate hydrolase subunit 2
MINSIRSRHDERFVKNSVKPLEPGVADPGRSRVAILHARKGPEWELVSGKSRMLLLNQEWQVAGRSDRMAVHLYAPERLSSMGGIISSPVVPGVVQLPGNGSPVVLFRDAQTIGGYPRIAVIDEDGLNKLAQFRPGGRLRIKIDE